ncbi:MAG TPA: hypothetical protein VGM13_15960 [Thermoanaerobaculia bacterium]|jgi:hypothetical protein
MKNLLTCLALGTFVALVAAPAPAYAQSERENSTFTVTEAVDVGSFTLQPGTYLIKVVLLESNRNLIQVTNEDQTKVFASVLATPHAITANEAAPTSRYVYYATAPGQRRALRTWYARDTTNGQDIVYSRQRAMEIAAVAKAPVIAIPDDVKETEYKTATLTVVTPEQQVKPYEAPAPVVMLAEAPPVRHLPATASHVPLFGLLGLVSVGGGLGLRILSTRVS